MTFRPNPEVRQAAGGELPSTLQVTGEVTGEVTDQVHPQLAVLKAFFGEMSRQEIQQALGLKHEDHFRNVYLTPTLQAGLIEMTIPDKPRSSKQKYRLTPAGHRYLRRMDTQANGKVRH